MLIGRDGLEYLNLPMPRLAWLELRAGEQRMGEFKSKVLRNILRCSNNLSHFGLCKGEWYVGGGSFEPEALQSAIHGLVKMRILTLVNSGVHDE